MDSLSDRMRKPVNSSRRPLRTHLIVTLCLSCGLISCSGSDADREAMTPVARKATTSLETPLTDQEVTTFLTIVRQLPDGRTPDFNSPATASIDDRLPATMLVTAYRREYRRLFDPTEQAGRFRSHPELIQALTDVGLAPEDFAILMTRLGCALAAGTVDSRINLAEAAEKADRQLQDLIHRIEQWDERAAQGAVSTSNVAPRRQPLVDQLKDLVALSEFSRLLISVPQQSRAVVEQRRKELAAHLPPSRDIRHFERTLDARAVIVPVHFEADARTPSTR